MHTCQIIIGKKIEQRGGVWKGWDSYVVNCLVVFFSLLGQGWICKEGGWSVPRGKQCSNKDNKGDGGWLGAAALASG